MNAYVYMHNIISMIVCMHVCMYDSQSPTTDTAALAGSQLAESGE